MHRNRYRTTSGQGVFIAERKKYFGERLHRTKVLQLISEAITAGVIIVEINCHSTVVTDVHRVLKTVDPVSYTHLDVYKRQILYGNPRLICFPQLWELLISSFLD